MRIIILVDAVGQRVAAALDNFKISVPHKGVYITDLGYGNVKGLKEIPVEEKSLTVYFNTELNAETVTADCVRLYCDDEEVIIKSVSYDGGVVLDIGERLKPKKKYRLEIINTVRDTLGVSPGSVLTTGFSTSYAQLDIKNLLLKTDENGTYIEGQMVDRLASAKTMYLVLTVWNGNRMVDINVTPLEFSDGIAFSSGYVVKGFDDTLEISLWDSFTCPDILVKESEVI